MGGTGKTEKITITNDKGRLSQEDIERMVQEAEEFQEEDKKVRDKIESRNALENYVYSMKNTLGDSEKGVADKIGDDDKETKDCHLLGKFELGGGDFGGDDDLDGH